MCVGDFFSSSSSSLFSVSFDAIGILLKAIALFKLSMNEHKTQMMKTRETSGCNSFSTQSSTELRTGTDTALSYRGLWGRNKASSGREPLFENSAQLHYYSAEWSPSSVSTSKCWTDVAKAENCRDWKCFLQHEKGFLFFYVTKVKAW